MKKFTYPITLIALLGLNVACNSSNDAQERQEAREEIGHEMDEFGDEAQEQGQDLKRGAEDLAD